jgi:hypothetical protein
MNSFGTKKRWQRCITVKALPYPIHSLGLFGGKENEIFNQHKFLGHEKEAQFLSPVSFRVLSFAHFS